MLSVPIDIPAFERPMREQAPCAGKRATPNRGSGETALDSLANRIRAGVAPGCRAAKLHRELPSVPVTVHFPEVCAAEILSCGSFSQSVLNRVLDHISANLGSTLSVSEIAAVAAMSPHHFSLCFKRAVGVAPHQWVMQTRILKAKELLRSRVVPVAQVAVSLGFASQSHFTDVFRRSTGTTPKRYQQRAR